MIITIDGPAGTGKSTVARRLADAIGFTYFDTGALYRAISWQVLELGVSYQDEQSLSKLLENFSFRARLVDGKQRYFVGNIDVTEGIRSQKVTAIVSEVAALKMVRDALRPLQTNFAQGSDAVFEGRDLGTVIFPSAHLKFFLTASPQVRAKRRELQLVEKFPNAVLSYETILKEIQERDTYDSSREHAPLRQAEDAILIDTSDYSVKEVVDKLKQIYLEKKG